MSCILRPANVENNNTLDLWVVGISRNTSIGAYTLQGTPTQVTAGGIDGDSRFVWMNQGDKSENTRQVQSLPGIFTPKDIDRRGLSLAFCPRSRTCQLICGCRLYFRQAISLIS